MSFAWYNQQTLSHPVELHLPVFQMTPQHDEVIIYAQPERTVGLTNKHLAGDRTNDKMLQLRVRRVGRQKEERLGRFTG